MTARERILDAAVKLIASEGIDDVRIARIAMAAGVSASLLHYHFDSREALLAEALEHSYEIAGNARISVPEDEPAPATRRLAVMIDQCLPLDEELRDDWVLWVELWLRAVRHPELRPTAARLYARMHTWFAEAIAAGVAAGEFTVADPERTADRLLALIDGYGDPRAQRGPDDAGRARPRGDLGGDRRRLGRRLARSSLQRFALAGGQRARTARLRVHHLERRARADHDRASGGGDRLARADAGAAGRVERAAHDGGAVAPPERMAEVDRDVRHPRVDAGQPRAQPGVARLLEVASAARQDRRGRRRRGRAPGS